MAVHYGIGRPPKWWWVALSLLALIYIMCGCKTVEYVPKVETKIEYRDRVERDTAYVRDSIYIRQKGDTVYLDKYKYIYKEHIRVDTAFVYRSDTITKIHTVEKRLTKWQSVKMDVGGYCIGTLALLLLILLAYIAYRVWKR